MKFFILISMFVCLFVTGFTPNCFATESNKELKFSKGASSTLVDGSVVRGDVDNYQIGVKAGQIMTIAITSTEKNAAFVIYLPKSEKTLQGAGEEDDAVKWTGKLPVTGIYKIAVSGTRGNATYKLKVSVK
jgi:hypothetical protein